MILLVLMSVFVLVMVMLILIVLVIVLCEPLAPSQHGHMVTGMVTWRMGHDSSIPWPHLSMVIFPRLLMQVVPNPNPNPYPSPNPNPNPNTNPNAGWSSSSDS